MKLLSIGLSIGPYGHYMPVMFSVLEDKVPITLGGNEALGQLVLAGP
jgi:hypothetical protein